MDNPLTLQEAKDQVAKKYGYTSWIAFVTYEIHKHPTTAFWGFIEEAASLYARSKWEQGIIEFQNTASQKAKDYATNGSYVSLWINSAPKPEFKP